VRRSRSPDPQPVKDILPRLLKEVLGGRGRKAERLRRAWSGVVGEAVAQRTRVVGLKHGVLSVEVASAALKHDLGLFRREEVLSGLRERLPEMVIREVSYRVGDRL